ncbi:MAG: hypothetical protein IIC66_04330 [candidate division Zixibacteria bacterium]|nr:hypothetical protein [candidate division Zixibacteria bacterium]
MNVQVEKDVAPLVAVADGDPDDAPTPTPDPLPLFEVRIEGAGPLALESTSQEALVDYIHHLALIDTEEVFFPFRVEYMKATGPDTPPEVARGTIYLDPSRIIIVGPERRPLAPIQPSEDFEALMSQFIGPVVDTGSKVILLSDEVVGPEDESGEEEK